MTPVLADFVKALRAAGVRVSSPEHMDAGRTLALIGLNDRVALKRALGMALPKSLEEKARFDACFDAFFAAHADIAADLSESAAQAVAGEHSQPGSTETPENDSAVSGDVAQALQQGDQAWVQQAIAAAGAEVQVQNIRLFTQRGTYVRRILEQLGIEALEARIAERVRDDPDDDDVDTLRLARTHLVEEVSGFVEQQLQLYTANAGQALREEVLYKSSLTRVESRDFKTMRELVRKLAKRLVSLHSRRRRRARRGALDLRHTIRRNVAYDGLLFDPVWKRVKLDRPKIIAVCDVSGSVAQVARFLLMFLYGVTEVLPRVRAFAFSGRLGEVTEAFESRPIEDAIEWTLQTWGTGSTDYGGALSELERLAGDEVDHRTTVLILGDARSNHGDPGHRALRRLHDRARRVIWLNPEPRGLWNTGDSEMQRLGACCDRVEPCRSLRQLERLVSELARSAV